VDEKAMARAAGKVARALAQFLIPGLRQLLLCLLLGSELLFFGYSLFKLVVNGPPDVLAWWYHLQAEGSSLEHIRDPFNWREFIVGHFVMLGLAALLYYYERRYQRHSKLALGGRHL
jgi:hypothetical protein